MFNTKKNTIEYPTEANYCYTSLQNDYYQDFTA